MDKKGIENFIINQIRDFQSQIDLPDGADSDMVDAVIMRMPQLLFYISDYQIQKRISASFQVESRLKIKYQNKDFDFSDIHAVTTEQDIMSLLNRYVGNYKTKLGIIIDCNLNISEIFNRFHEKYSVMFPHFTQASMSSVSMGDMLLVKFDFTYRIGKVKLALMDNEIQAEVEKVASRIFFSDMPKEVKAYIAHNYLATTIVYYGADAISNLEKSYVHSAYGALITKKCVCQGIADAYKRILDKGEVPCDIVCGSIIGQENYHAWNIVKLNDKDCFHIDVTWDISKGKPSLSYFGKNDAFLEKTRVWNHSYNAKCQSTKNLFMMAKHYIIQNKESLIQRGISKNVLCI